MKTLAFFLALVTVAVSNPRPAWSQHHQHGTEGKEIVNKLCPVMGNPVNQDITTKHDGKLYAFCCAGCIPRFRKDPASYLGGDEPVKPSTGDSKAMDSHRDGSHKDYGKRKKGCCGGSAEPAKHTEDTTHPWVRPDPVSPSAADGNGDGYVYQDPMHWNVIADEQGECPLCGMKLKKVTLRQAHENLTEHGYDVVAVD